ncbi:MAG: hypothetical protein ACLPKE_06985, partial [Streptosporangiaceae bacterium]
MTATKTRSTALTSSAYALLADGPAAEIRPATPCDTAVVTAAVRERGADVASLRRVFAPESVAVVWASRRMGTTGRAI